MSQLFQSGRADARRIWGLIVLLTGMCWPGSVLAQSPSPALSHAQRAQEFLSRNDLKDAIPELKAALAADPNNLEVKANLGVLLFFQQDYAAAIPYLRDAVAQKPDLSKIRALLGLAEKYLGDASNARTDLEAAVPQLTETSFQIQAGLALIEIDAALQDFDKAESVITLLRKAAPTDPRILYTAYRIATDQASEAMLSLSLAAPDSAQMHQAMAHELERALDTPGAIANFRKAAKLEPGLPGIHFELAEALKLATDEKDKAEAESEYKLALQQNPRDARSAVALGNFAKARGDSKAAAGYYQQAFAIDPQSEDAAIELADLDAQKKDFTAAAAKLEQVTKADPTNILAHYRLSRIYRQLGRSEDAQREIDAFLHFKDMRERMRTVYQQMRQKAPGGQEELPEEQVK